MRDIDKPNLWCRLVHYWRHHRFVHRNGSAELLSCTKCKTCWWEQA